MTRWRWVREKLLKSRPAEPSSRNGLTWHLRELTACPGKDRCGSRRAYWRLPLLFRQTPAPFGEILSEGHAGTRTHFDCAHVVPADRTVEAVVGQLFLL